VGLKKYTDAVNNYIYILYILYNFGSKTFCKLIKYFCKKIWRYQKWECWHE